MLFFILTGLIIGIIIGFKAVILFYISMILNWVGIFGLSISIISFFGLLNGFFDAIIIWKKYKTSIKVISCSVGIFLTLSIMYLLGNKSLTFDIFNYIHYKNYGFIAEEFGPAGGAIIIFYFFIYSVSSLFISFLITIINNVISKYH